MTFFLQAVILVAGIAGAIALGGKWNKDTDTVGIRWITLPFAIILVIVTIGLLSSVGQISAGNRGVVLRFGATTDKTFGEGLYFKTPFVESVEVMSVQTEKHTADVSAASRDLQIVNATITLNYRLSPTRVNEIYRDLRRDYVNRVIAPFVQEGVKSTTAKFNAEELITRREEVRVLISESLNQRLSTVGVETLEVSIENFSFSEVFDASIEAKQVAEQAALEAERVTVRVREEAKQTEARAIGEANAIRARAEADRDAAIFRAEGEANAIRVRAEAQAQANELINASLTDELIRWNLVDGITVDTMILPSGSEFIIGPEVLGTKATAASTSN